MTCNDLLVTFLVKNIFSVFVLLVPQTFNTFAASILNQAIFMYLGDSVTPPLIALESCSKIF